MRKVVVYLGKLFADQNGNPLARRYACALFGITAIILSFCNYDIELVAVFVAATFGENIINIFSRKRGKNEI